MTDDEVLRAALGYEHRPMPWWWAALIALALFSVLGAAFAIAECL